jgi:PAS domain S-box-containing protein
VATKEELQKQIAKLEAAQKKAEVLYQISHDLNTARDEQELLQLLDQPARTAGASSTNLLYIDLDEAGQPEWARVVAFWYQKDKPVVEVGTTYYLPEFSFTHLFLSSPNEPLLIPDAESDKTIDKNTQILMAQLDMRATAIIPLTQKFHHEHSVRDSSQDLAKRRWVGLIIFNWSEPHEFSEQEVEIFNSLIGLASPAVESRRLVNNLEQMVEDRAAELQQSQQMLQLVLDTMPTRVFWKDKDLNYLGCNCLYADDAGLDSPEEIIGKNDFELAWAKQAELYRSDDRQVIESGIPKLNYEEPQTTPDGSQIWLRSSKIPLRDKEDNVTAILGTYDDITEMKQAEAERERLQQEVIEAQQRAIQELSTPIIPIMDRIIVLPLIGSIDTMRARDITRSLLAGISTYRAKVVILDVTGVGIMDTGIVNHLNRTIQAARLKGAHTIVTGVSDAVAEAIVDLGIDWSAVTTLANLQTGLMVALDNLGVKLIR